MDSERWDISDKPRRSFKTRLWPSVKKSKHWKKQKKYQRSNNTHGVSKIPIPLGGVDEVETIDQSVTRSSTPGVGGTHTVITADVHAADIYLEPNQPLTSVPVHQSYYRLHAEDAEITADENVNEINFELHQSPNIESTNPSLNSNPEKNFSAIHLTSGQENKEESQITRLEGRRIIDICYLFEQLARIDHGPFDCSFKYFKFTGETRSGFHSSFKFICEMCGVKVIIRSDQPGNQINENAVHGIVTSGNGYAQLQEFCAHMDIPCMSDKLFIKESNVFSSRIKDLAVENMYQAGLEEREIAIAKGNIDPDGIPYITVVVDGSWAKRSYKTNYNSLSGVSCIIGFETKKILFLGIRNAYCCVCAVAKNKNISPKEHHCFKNWNKSSTAMEADGIVEGFKRSIDMHQIRYKTLIGDGDSSVTSALSGSLPYGHGTIIKKIECSNHLLRNYCSKLRTLVKKTENKFGPVPVTLRKKLECNIIRLRKAIKGAVDYTSKESNITSDQKIINLKQDLLNSPCHVFGDHEKCKKYFCKGVAGENLVPAMKECGLWYEVYSILGTVVTNAESLLMAHTNNIAEQFNAVIAKFIGGKRVNYCLRGSYETRCYAAATKHNTGSLLKTLGKETAIAKKYIQRVANKNKRKSDTDRGTKRMKKKYLPADENYGNLEQEADIDPEIYKKKKEDLLLLLKQGANQRLEIQIKTLGQVANQEWLNQRKFRLTASYFGQVCKLKPTTSGKNIVKEILYSQFKGNAATKYGQENESNAIRDAENILGLHIEPSGFFIDENLPYLGASPDGLIGNEGIVEIKCPASAASLTPAEAILNKKIKFCTIDDNLNGITLKRSHNFFYQIQGQLHITGRKYCFFIVWTPKGLLYEKIEKDDEFWNSTVGKLEEFYYKCILPELIDPRLPRNLPIRDRI